MTRTSWPRLRRFRRLWTAWSRAFAPTPPLSASLGLATETDRIEFEFGWLAFGFLLGVGYLSAGADPRIGALLPGWFTYAWAAAFLLGGLVGAWGVRGSFSIVGIQRYWGLAAERAGHTAQAAAVSTLGIAVVYAWLNRPPDSVTPFPVLSLALATVWMVIALRRIVRVTQIIRAMTHKGNGIDNE